MADSFDYWDSSLFPCPAAQFAECGLVPAASVGAYLGLNPSSVLVAVDPRLVAAGSLYYDSASYSSWQDAWALVDYVLLMEAGDYLRRHPKAALVWFEVVYPEKLSIWG